MMLPWVLRLWAAALGLLDPQAPARPDLLDKSRPAPAPRCRAGVPGRAVSPHTKQVWQSPNRLPRPLTPTHPAFPPRGWSWLAPLSRGLWASPPHLWGEAAHHRVLRVLWALYPAVWIVRWSHLPTLPPPNAHTPQRYPHDITYMDVLHPPQDESSEEVSEEEDYLTTVWREIHALEEPVTWAEFVRREEEARIAAHWRRLPVHPTPPQPKPELHHPRELAWKALPPAALALGIVVRAAGWRALSLSNYAPSAVVNVAEGVAIKWPLHWRPTGPAKGGPRPAPRPTHTAKAHAVLALSRGPLTTRGGLLKMRLAYGALPCDSRKGWRGLPNDPESRAPDRMPRWWMSRLRRRLLYFEYFLRPAQFATMYTLWLNFFYRTTYWPTRLLRLEPLHRLEPSMPASPHKDAQDLGGARRLGPFNDALVTPNWYESRKRPRSLIRGPIRLTRPSMTTGAGPAHPTPYHRGAGHPARPRKAAQAWAVAEGPVSLNPLYPLRRAPSGVGRRLAGALLYSASRPLARVSRPLAVWAFRPSGRRYTPSPMPVTPWRFIHQTDRKAGLGLPPRPSALERALFINAIGWSTPHAQGGGYRHAGGAGGSPLFPPEGSPRPEKRWLWNQVYYMRPRRYFRSERPNHYRPRRFFRFKVWPRIWPPIKKRVRPWLVAAVACRTWLRFDDATLGHLLNPWPDHDWMLETAVTHKSTPPELARWMAFPGAFPLQSNRGIRDLWYTLWAWVDSQLLYSWWRGLGRTGPTNGHRRAMRVPLGRSIAGRHNTWAVDVAWHPDVLREGAALSDPAWRGTLRFWGWEPSLGWRQGGDEAWFRWRATAEHVRHLMFRSDGPLSPTATLLDYGALRGRHMRGASLGPVRPWTRQQLFRTNFVDFPTGSGLRLVRPLRKDLRWFPIWLKHSLFPKHTAPLLYQLPTGGRHQGHRALDTWAHEGRGVDHLTTLVARSINFWSQPLYSRPVYALWTTAFGSFRTLQEGLFMAGGGRLWAAWVALRFKVRYLWGMGYLRACSVAWAEGLPRGRPGRYIADAPDRQAPSAPPLMVVARLRRALALASLWLGPEPAAAWLARRGGRCLAAGFAAYMCGLTAPHPWAPSPLTPDPSPGTPLLRGCRAARVAWGADLAGRAPWRLPPLTPHCDLDGSPAISDVVDLPTPPPRPRALGSAKSLTTNPLDQRPPLYEGATYSRRPYRVYSDYLGARPNFHKSAAPAPTWAGDAIPADLAPRLGLRWGTILRGEWGHWGQHYLFAQAPVDRAWGTHRFKAASARVRGHREWPTPVYRGCATQGRNSFYREASRLDFAWGVYRPARRYTMTWGWRTPATRADVGWSFHPLANDMFARREIRSGDTPLWRHRSLGHRHPNRYVAGPYSGSPRYHLCHSWWRAGQVETPRPRGGPVATLEGLPLRRPTPSGVRPLLCQSQITDRAAEAVTPLDPLVTANWAIYRSRLRANPVETGELLRHLSDARHYWSLSGPSSQASTGQLGHFRCARPWARLATPGRTWGRPTGAYRGPGVPRWQWRGAWTPWDYLLGSDVPDLLNPYHLTPRGIAMGPRSGRCLVRRTAGFVEKRYNSYFAAANHRPPHSHIEDLAAHPLSVTLAEYKPIAPGWVLWLELPSPHAHVLGRGWLVSRGGLGSYSHTRFGSHVTRQIQAIRGPGVSQYRRPGAYNDLFYAPVFEARPSPSALVLHKLRCDPHHALGAKAWLQGGGSVAKGPARPPGIRPRGCELPPLGGGCLPVEPLALEPFYWVGGGLRRLSSALLWAAQQPIEPIRGLLALPYTRAGHMTTNQSLARPLMAPWTLGGGLPPTQPLCEPLRRFTNAAIRWQPPSLADIYPRLVGPYRALAEGLESLGAGSAPVGDLPGAAAVASGALGVEALWLVAALSLAAAAAAARALAAVAGSLSGLKVPTWVPSLPAPLPLRPSPAAACPLPWPQVRHPYHHPWPLDLARGPLNTIGWAGPVGAPAFLVAHLVAKEVCLLLWPWPQRALRLVQEAYLVVDKPWLWVPFFSVGVGSHRLGQRPKPLWPRHYPLDLEPGLVGFDRKPGHHYRGPGAWAYEVGRALANAKAEAPRRMYGNWDRARARVPGTDIRLYHHDRTFVAPLGIPNSFLKWYAPRGQWDYEHRAVYWHNNYAARWRKAFNIKNTFGLNWHWSPQGYGPANAAHTAVYPDLLWAKPKNPLHHSPSNKALMLRGEDVSPALIGERRVGVPGVLLLGEPTHHVWPRLTPLSQNPYRAYALWEGFVGVDLWLGRLTPRNLLGRVVGLGGSSGTNRRPRLRGWGGGWSNSRAFPEGWGQNTWARRASTIRFSGPTDDHPEPLRPQAAPYGIEKQNKVGPRLLSARPMLRGKNLSGPGLDPSNIPWLAQATLRGLAATSGRPGVGYQGGGWLLGALRAGLTWEGWGGGGAWGGLFALWPNTGPEPFARLARTRAQPWTYLGPDAAASRVTKPHQREYSLRAIERREGAWERPLWFVFGFKVCRTRDLLGFYESDIRPNSVRWALGRAAAARPTPCWWDVYSWKAAAGVLTWEPWARLCLASRPALPRQGSWVTPKSRALMYEGFNLGGWGGPFWPQSWYYPRATWPAPRGPRNRTITNDLLYFAAPHPMPTNQLRPSPRSCRLASRCRFPELYWNYTLARALIGPEGGVHQYSYVYGAPTRYEDPDYNMGHRIAFASRRSAAYW